MGIPVWGTDRGLETHKVLRSHVNVFNATDAYTLKNG